MPATPLFSFHLKQVQYATTPSNLDSLEGETGEGEMGGCFERRGWGRRRKASKVLQGASSMYKFFN